MSDIITEEQKRIKENTPLLKLVEMGPYLSERQWATVREDYSPMVMYGIILHMICPAPKPIVGEDGIAGISDNNQRICFAIALWNGKDEILKERLFGLTPLMEIMAKM